MGKTVNYCIDCMYWSKSNNGDGICEKLQEEDLIYICCRDLGHIFTKKYFGCNLFKQNE